MEYVKGITYVGAKKGEFINEEAKASIKNMITSTNCNTIMLYAGALQDTPQSEDVDYKYRTAPSDEEYIELIKYVKSLGLKVYLEPTVNCKDGTWRAFINFFDHDVPCEPKWSVWFNNYIKFVVHYAKIAEQTGCEYFSIGSEMVMAEHRLEEWTKLIGEVRDVYKGKVTYIADKYSEENVPFWGQLDFISTGGHYTIDVWENELKRLKCLGEKYKKPIIIGQVGCKSSYGSSKCPNEWAFQGPLDMHEQVRYLKTVLEVCEKSDFINGIGIWQWGDHLYAGNNATNDKGYAISGKPVCNLIREAWS